MPFSAAAPRSPASNPSLFNTRPRAAFGVGNTLRKLGRYAEALEQYTSFTRVSAKLKTTSTFVNWFAHLPELWMRVHGPTGVPAAHGKVRQRCLLTSPIRLALMGDGGARGAVGDRGACEAARRSCLWGGWRPQNARQLAVAAQSLYGVGWRCEAAQLAALPLCLHGPQHWLASHCRCPRPPLHFSRPSPTVQLPTLHTFALHPAAREIWRWSARR